MLYVGFSFIQLHFASYFILDPYFTYFIIVYLFTKSTQHMSETFPFKLQMSRYQRVFNDNTLKLDMRTPKMRDHRTNALIELIASLPRPHIFEPIDLLHALNRLNPHEASAAVDTFSKYIASLSRPSRQIETMTKSLSDPSTFDSVAHHLLYDHSLSLTSGPSANTYTVSDALLAQEQIVFRNTKTNNSNNLVHSINSIAPDEAEIKEITSSSSKIHVHAAPPVTDHPIASLPMAASPTESDTSSEEGLEDVLCAAGLSAAYKLRERNNWLIDSWVDCILHLVDDFPNGEFTILELLAHFNSLYPKIDTPCNDDKLRRTHFIMMHNRKISVLLARKGVCVKSRPNPLGNHQSRMLYSFPRKEHRDTASDVKINEESGQNKRKLGQLEKRSLDRKAKQDANKRLKLGRKDEETNQIEHQINSSNIQGANHEGQQVQVPDAQHPFANHSLANHPFANRPPMTSDTSLRNNNQNLEAKIQLMKSTFELFKAQSQLQIQCFEALLRNVN